MPGMWDCHGHFLGMRTLDLGRLPLEPVPLRAARCARDLAAALRVGITSVREVGGLGVYLARAVTEGVLDGPAIYAAGAILSTTGGHADLHSYPLPWIGDLAAHYGELRLADGTAECMRAVREQLRKNARVIKVCASGGVLSEIDDPIHQQFTLAELRVIVEVAGLAERVVAAHCHGKPGIMAAIEAGVRTIEHGTYLDDEACDAMRETGSDPRSDQGHHRGHPGGTWRRCPITRRPSSPRWPSGTRKRCPARSSAASRSRWVPTSG